MTESFRHEDTSSERVQLEDGQVEVFFDGEGSDRNGSIILDTAQERKVTEGTPFGMFEYEELILPNGDVLVPADMSLEERVMEFSNSLEPVVRLSATSLLRTVEYRREMLFLDIIRNDSTIAERKAVRHTLLVNERERVPSVLTQQGELFDADETLELWLRLEAVNNPDKDLVGKIIMARLAFFVSHDTQIGVTPMIFNATNGITTRIPEQLGIHEVWLYSDGTEIN
jgi:hypothetical protein